jgi:hypothetical protein
VLVEEVPKSPIAGFIAAVVARVKGAVAKIKGRPVEEASQADGEGVKGISSSAEVGGNGGVAQERRVANGDTGKRL